MKQRKTNLSELPKEGFVRLPQILAVIPISKSQFWLGVKNGHFPRPIKLGAKTTAWRVEDIRELSKAQSEYGKHFSRPHGRKRGIICKIPFFLWSQTKTCLQVNSMPSSR